MPCIAFKLPDWSTAIAHVRGAKRKFPRCKFCPVELMQACDAKLLCDFVVGKTRGGKDITCDKPICDHCAKEVGPDKHFCPRHAK